MKTLILKITGEELECVSVPDPCEWQLLINNLVKGNPAGTSLHYIGKMRHPVFWMVLLML